MERPEERGPESKANECTHAEGAATSVKERILDGSPLAGLGAPSRAALLQLGSLERLSRRQRIIQQGESARHVILLGTGRVKLERVAEGRVFPMGHRGPGQIVGETALAFAPSATESATVVDEGDAVLLPISGLHRLMAAFPDVRGAAAAAMVQQKLAAEARLGSLLLRSVEARLLEFLEAAAWRWGEPHPSGQLVSTPFTHAEIALLIGSTRETVTLLLGKLKRAGLIAFDRRRVVIRDSESIVGRAGTS